MDPLPSLDALRTLFDVESAGSVTAASRLRSITQQAASARIRLLEARTGLALITRSGSGTALTPAGLLVARWASDVLASADRFADAVGALRTDADARLSVVASLTVAEHLLPRWLVALRAGGAAGPERSTVAFEAGNSARVIDAVRTGTAALGFIESPDVPADLRSCTVASDELVVVVAPGHRWTRSAPPTLAALAAAPLVLREEGSGTRRAQELALAERRLAASAPAAVLSTAAAVRAAVIAGVAPAVLSVLAVQDDVALGRLVLVRLEDARLVRPITAVWRGSLVAAAARLLTVATAEDERARAAAHPR